MTPSSRISALLRHYFLYKMTFLCIVFKDRRCRSFSVCVCCCRDNVDDYSTTPSNCQPLFCKFSVCLHNTVFSCHNQAFLVRFFANLQFHKPNIPFFIPSAPCKCSICIFLFSAIQNCLFLFIYRVLTSKRAFFYLFDRIVHPFLMNSQPFSTVNETASAVEYTTSRRHNA